MKQLSVQTILESEDRALAQEYAELLISRITHSSMSLEKDLGNSSSSENAIRLRDNMKAFKYLLANLPSKNSISEEMIITVGNLINESSPYISNGYRTHGEYLAETDIPISQASNISMDMHRLLTQYEQEKNYLNRFVREAQFHINFIKIHPFEDGNGRTGRLLLNYNLLKEGIAPVIITDDLTEYYQSYIRNEDVNGMANLFAIQSKKEQQVIERIASVQNNNIDIPSITTSHHK